MANSKSGNKIASNKNKSINVKKKNKPIEAKIIDTLERTKDSSFPWELIANCALFIILLIINEWSTKIEGQLYFALGSAVILFISMLKKSNRDYLFAKMTPIFIFLFAQCLFYFIGLFYAWYPKFALQQFFMNIGGLFIFASSYVCFLRDKKNVGIFALILSIGIAIVSLISIELATSRHLLVFFEKIADSINAKLPQNFSVFETNTRVITVLGNPNVYAPIAVFGMFLSLWNCGKQGDRKIKSAISMGLAIVCGATFILTFSMGTILVYIATVFGILILSKKEMRDGFIAKNIICLIFAFIEAFTVFALRENGMLPLVSVAALSAVFAFLYSYIKPIKLPNIKVKKLPVIGAIAVVLVLCVCAYVLQGSYTLEKGGSFKRAIALDEGAYSLEVDYEALLDDPFVSVEIYSMSYTQATLKETTTLKKATLKSGDLLEFKVPEDSAAVFFKFTAKSLLTISEARVAGEAGEKDLALRYMLLPEFIVNRMQGLWVNDNAIQRFIFFRDGIRLGLKSPVIGQGGGAYQGGLFSVADYYYETKHTHNEYIERFIDGGLIGLLLFLALTFYIFKALFKFKKSDGNSGIYPLILGCMLMIFLHAFLEVDFLMTSYRLVASMLFALAAAVCADTVKLSGKLRPAMKVSFAAIFIVAVVLAFGRSRAMSMLSNNPSLKTLQTAAVLDPFNGEDYKISYLINTKDNTTSSLTMSRQSEYLSELENRKLSTDSLHYLVEFYLTKAEPDVDKGILAAEKYLHEKRINAGAWDEIFIIYVNTLNRLAGDPENTAKIINSTRKLTGYLQELNSSLPKTIEPEYALYTLLLADMLETDGNVIIDSRVNYDLDMNGLSDIVKSFTGDKITWDMQLPIPAMKLYRIRIYQPESAICELSQEGQALGYEYNAAEGCFESYIFSATGEPTKLIISTDQYSESTYFIIEKSEY